VKINFSIKGNGLHYINSISDSLLLNLRVYQNNFEIFYEISNSILVCSTTMKSCITNKLMIPFLTILIEKVTNFSETYQQELEESILFQKNKEINKFVNENDIKFCLLSIKCKLKLIK
jgi:hypothetical protein